jgi:hypothetical protein
MLKPLVSTLAIALWIAALGAPQALASTVYKWTDAEGVVHFGSRAPNNTNSTAISPKTGHSEPVNYHQNQPKTPQEPAASAPQASSKKAAAKPNPERCQAAQSNLEVLQRGGRIREPTDDGSYRFLNEEQKSQRIERAQQVVEESC